MIRVDVTIRVSVEVDDPFDQEDADDLALLREAIVDSVAREGLDRDHVTVDRVWSDERNCECEDDPPHADPCGWIHDRSAGEIQRCDTCQRFEGDGEARQAHDASGCACGVGAPPAELQPGMFVEWRGAALRVAAVYEVTPQGTPATARLGDGVGLDATLVWVSELTILVCEGCDVRTHELWRSERADPCEGEDNGPSFFCAGCFFGG